MKGCEVSLPVCSRACRDISSRLRLSPYTSWSSWSAPRTWPEPSAEGRAPPSTPNDSRITTLRKRLPTRQRSMNCFYQPVGASHVMVVGAVMFVAGVVCMATKRNALGILMGIELVLNGANVNFVAFSSDFLRSDLGFFLGLDGQYISLFVIVLAAAEAAVALA